MQVRCYDPWSSLLYTQTFSTGSPISLPRLPSPLLGPLMGGGGDPQCRLSILRNGNVPCHYFIDFPVDFQSVQCRLSILRNRNVLCHYILNFPVDFKSLMSPVEFKKRPCRPVEFKGQGPFLSIACGCSMLHLSPFSFLTYREQASATFCTVLLGWVS